MEGDTRQDEEDRIAPWIELLEREEKPGFGWRTERAALALAGSGARAADGPLRRYGGKRSADGSWRATRWLELPRILSLPIPERLSAIWAMFPRSEFALALARPTADEMRLVLKMALGQVGGEERERMPIGSPCLRASASMAKELGLRLPPFETPWWLEQELWGTADAPTSSADGGAMAAVATAAHPLFVRDPMTNAFSRGALREDPRDMEDSPMRNLGSGWVLLADIDHFKGLNASRGFLQGDCVLSQLVDRLQRAFGDCVVRHAGEEFLVFWEAAGGMGVAEEMRRLVEADPFWGRQSDEPMDVTISVGAARFDEVSCGIENAHTAMVEAKNAGRNCVRASSLKRTRSP